MSRTTTPVLLFPLAALFAVAFPFALRFRQSSIPLSEAGSSSNVKITHRSAQAEPGAEDHLSSDKHNAIRILSQYFGVQNYLSASFPPSDIRSEYCIHFLIATVPDPIDSRLPHLFDRFLGSIQRAAEADDLVLDRFDLPWVEELNKKQTKANSSGGGSPAVPSESNETHDHLLEPGYLLFRQPLVPHQPLKKDRPPQLWLVFVVGETPTAGIHKDALLSALQQIDLLSATEAQKQERIKILGPSFSGSAESLRTVLVNWLQKSGSSVESPGPRRIHIVSGSATAVSTSRQNFPDGSQQPSGLPYYFDLAGAGGEVEFETTVVTDDAALNDFFYYLSDKHARAHKGAVRVGLLTEANTSYGNSLQQQFKKQFKEQASSPVTQKKAASKTHQLRPSAEKQSQPAPSSSAPADTGTASAPAPCTPDEAITLTVLPFPLHISQLRSELERNRAQQNKNAEPATQNQDSSKTLPVPFGEENSESTDSIPPFSQLEPPTSELVLSNLLSTLSREHFDYVGVAASDVRDTIFLAREVREHSPSSVIFSLNADLLYAHPEANPNTRGMLVITPYPLFTLNQVWTNPSNDRVRLQFPDQNSEGVYNAMLLLISRDTRLLEYGMPFRGISVSQTHLESADRFRKPPVWLTTVGRGGFWPVALLPDRCTSPRTHLAETPATKGTQSPENPGDALPDHSQGMMPHATALVFFVWSCLCSIPALAFLWQELWERFIDRSKCGEISVPPIPRLFCESLLAKNRSESRTYFLVAGIAVLSAYIVALSAMGASSFRIWELSLRTGFFLAMIVGAVLALCACFLLARDAVGSPATGADAQPSNWLLWGPVFVVGLLGMGFSFALAHEWLGTRFRLDADIPFAVNGILTGYRALNLASGVSPLLPVFLIALAGCAWAISALRRVRLAEALPWIGKSECNGQENTPCAQDVHGLFNSTRPFFSGFAPIENTVQELLRSPSLQLPGSLQWVSIMAAGVVGTAVIYLFYLRLVQAFESSIFYLFFGLCFLVVYLSIVFNTLRLLFLWLGLRRLLRNIERHRLRRAFPRFYKNYPNLPRINLASAPPPLTALSFLVEQAQELLRSARTLLPSGFPFAGVIDRMAPEISLAASAQRAALASENAKDQCGSLIAQLNAQRALARVSCQIEDALSCIWSANSPAPSADDNNEKENRKLVERAEEFLVGRTVLFLSHIFPQMTNLAGLSLASLLLLLMAVSSYPFQPHQLIVLFSWIVIFAFVAVALFMSVQMNRDTLLSNLNGTKPGELNWDREFVSRILLYVVVPVLGFLGVQFPDAIAQLFSFLSPGAAGHG